MTRQSRFALTLVALIVLPRSDTAMTAAGQQRTRPQTPAPVEFFEVHTRSILELQAAQAEGRVTSRGLVDAYLARIAAYDHWLMAVFQRRLWPSGFDNMVRRVGNFSQAAQPPASGHGPRGVESI